MDLTKVRKALGGNQVVADPNTLDPAVGPGGGTHDTDIEIADDVVKLVDVNSPNTPDLETRAYQSGTTDDGSEGTAPYDGNSSVDGIPELPDTLSASEGRGTTPLGGQIGGPPQPEVEDPNAIAADAGDPQKSNGGGGPVVQLPDTLEDELSVAPKDPHASVNALTTADIADLRKILSDAPNSNVAKAVKALQWLDRNANNPKVQQVRAGLDKWSPSPAQAQEAQARYGFEYLHTEASALPEKAQQTVKVLAWLKTYITASKLKIAADFLSGPEAKTNPALAKQISAWYKTTAVDQVTENKENVGVDDITLYGPQNGSPSHKPSPSDDGFTDPKVVDLHDVPFKDPSRHPAEAGAEVDEQTVSPSVDSNAVDSGSFSAKGDDRGKELNTPSAATQTQANPMTNPMMGLGGPEEVEAPPVPGMPPAPVDPMADPMAAPPVPGMDPMAAPPVDPMAAPPVDPMAAPPVDPMADPMAMDPGAMDPMAAPPGMPGMEEGIPPVLPEGPPELPGAEGMGGGGGGMPMAPAAGPDGGVDPGMGGQGMDLEQWLQEELMADPMSMDPAQSAHTEMLSNFDEIGPVTREDVVMALYGAEQENPHWNIDIKGRPVARVELSDQPKPEEVRSTFLSGGYAVSISEAMVKVGVSEVLTAINAKSYAAKIEVGKLAEKIKAKVASEMETVYAAKIGELRDRFLTAAKIALAGYNSNFFRGEDHPLKAALWSELGRLGIRDAAGVIEASFDDGSVPFFEAVLAKAEELMDLPDEARDAIAKAIPESNALVTASVGTRDDLPTHETLASALEGGNMFFTSETSPVIASRAEVTSSLRERVRLRTFRSS